ncbi:MAG: response regulator [Deltaproteobacteria bacterium]|nr:response regulator [Deltaproteobacteria bacterium]
MSLRKNILIIDSNDSHYELLSETLKETELKPVLFRAQDRSRGEKLLKSRRFDLVLTENGHATEDADWVADLKAAARGAPLVILTSRADEKKAVAAMKMGADDYIIKNRECLKNLDQILSKAIELRHKRDANTHAVPPSSSPINLLSRNLRIISEYINQPSKGIAEGKRKIRQLEKELDNIKSLLKNFVS